MTVPGDGTPPDPGNNDGQFLFGTNPLHPGPGPYPVDYPLPRHERTPIADLPIYTASDARGIAWRGFLLGAGVVLMIVSVVLSVMI